MVGQCSGIQKISIGAWGGHSGSLRRRNIWGRDGMKPLSVKDTEVTQKKRGSKYSSLLIRLVRVRLRRGWKGVGNISLTLGDCAMKTGRGVGAATDTLGDGATGVTVGYGDVVVSGRGVGGEVQAMKMTAGAAWRERGSMRDQWEWRSIWKKY